MFLHLDKGWRHKGLVYLEENIHNESYFPDCTVSGFNANF